MRSEPSENGIDEVICDSERATNEAVEYLLSLATGRSDSSAHSQKETINEHRFNRYAGALRKAGIEYDDSLVVNTILTATGGYQATKKLIGRESRMPTAIFCGNDVVAMGVLKALDEAGYSTCRTICRSSASTISDRVHQARVDDDRCPQARSWKACRQDSSGSDRKQANLPDQRQAPIHADSAREL